MSSSAPTTVTAPSGWKGTDVTLPKAARDGTGSIGTGISGC
jgi:hypothetical protein